MKKRSILVTVLAVVLACVISVGGTFAYLTAKDDQVVNTFKFADGMEVTLKEEPPTNPPENVTVKENDKNGVDYENIVPGQTLPKQPTVETKTTVDAYLFIRVSGATAEVHPEVVLDENKQPLNGKTNPIEGEGWTYLCDGDGNFNGVYYRVVNAADANKGPWNVFQQVKVSDQVQLENKPVDGSATDTGFTTLKDIQIDVYEIQKATFDTPQDAYDAIPAPFHPATTP